MTILHPLFCLDAFQLIAYIHFRRRYFSQRGTLASKTTDRYFEKWVCVCVSVCERERGSVCFCECVRVFVCTCACMCEKQRKTVCVCACVCVCVCVTPCRKRCQSQNRRWKVKLDKKIIVASFLVCLTWWTGTKWVNTQLLFCWYVVTKLFLRLYGFNKKSAFLSDQM